MTTLTVPETVEKDPLIVEGRRLLARYGGEILIRLWEGHPARAAYPGVNLDCVCVSLAPDSYATARYIFARGQSPLWCWAAGPVPLTFLPLSQKHQLIVADRRRRVTVYLPRPLTVIPLLESQRQANDTMSLGPIWQIPADNREDALHNIDWQGCQVGCSCW